MESLNGGNGHGGVPGLSPASAAGIANGVPIGEIVDTAVADFVAQACQLNVAPPFGANVNLPPTQRKGFELELGYEVGTWLSLSADYVYMVAKFKQGDFGGVDVSGKNIPLVPRHQGGLKATVTPRQHLQVTGVVSYVGEQYYDNDQSNSFGRKMPAYTVVDLAATLDRGAWSWSASARNILNEAYYSYGIRSIAAPTCRSCSRR